MSIHATIDRYFALGVEIRKHLAYQEVWRSFPLTDEREMYWCVDGGSILLSTARDTLERWLLTDDDSGECYTFEIVKAGVFRTPEVTAVRVDTHTDGNVYLMLVRNDRELRRSK